MTDERLTSVRRMSHFRRDPMKRITLRLPDQQIEMLESMVEAGEFPTVSEAVRDAVRQLIEKRAARVLRESDQVSFKV
jgi:Predicted transcriptional regulators containing the CopG/Arc/MetJ DNA-binding domain and a metal-binding domain